MLPLLGLMLATAAPSPSASAAGCAGPPVLLVHGLDDSARSMAPLQAHLERGGRCPVETVSLLPSNGQAPIATLAAQVARAAEALRARTGASRVDLVGFSMGALVSRYYLQRLGGRPHVRRYVSISGPHAGSVLAFIRGGAGIRDMRPGSPLLRELAADPEPFAGVEVFSLWTPLDLTILPPSSSRLPGAHERTIPVVAHPLMLLDGRVLRAVEEALRVTRPEDFQPPRPPPLPPPL